MAELADQAYCFQKHLYELLALWIICIEKET